MKSRFGEGRPVVLNLACALGFLGALATSGEASAGDSESDPDMVVAVMRELFPEVDSQSVLPVVAGQPVARLTAALAFDAARARARQSYDSYRSFHGGATLAGFGDRTRTRDVALAVAAPGGRVVGTVAIARKGRGITIDVFPAPTTGAVPLPPRRALPEPVMWLFPMVAR
jgi:hypothetical protein